MQSDANAAEEQSRWDGSECAQAGGGLCAAGVVSCWSASVPRGSAGLAQLLAILHPEQEH